MSAKAFAQLQIVRTDLSWNRTKIEYVKEDIEGEENEIDRNKNRLREMEGKSHTKDRNEERKCEQYAAESVLCCYLGMI
jgi:hypothetical protein